MGYRSTFVTDEQALKLPDWFVAKWASSVYINATHTLPIASKAEFKTYGHWYDLPYDLQLCIKEQNENWERSVHLIFLHEDGKTTQLLITKDKVIVQYRDELE